jgi:hypothetical protein
MNAGGIGWIDGFDELLARCGLDHNGAPYHEGGTTYPLHGRIASIPAHYVAVHIDDNPPHALTVEGHVDESRLFGPQLRMTTTLTTEPGSTRFHLRDTFHNLGDQPTDLQVLYHWNLGPPLLEAGSRFVAPWRTVVPRDARAVEGLASHDTYAAPTPGFAEQVYYLALHGDTDGNTLVLLRNAAGDRGVALRFDLRQLPCFSLWKSTQGLHEGYVTGLEPAVNFPNPHAFEKDNGRAPVLAPGASFVAETTLLALDTRDAVAAIEAEIAALQAAGDPIMHARPRKGLSPHA